MRRRVVLVLPMLALAHCAQPTPPASPRRVMVFFTADSAALDPAAQAAVKEAADAAMASPQAITHVRGFAAPDAGSAAFNKALSEARAQGVADALAAAGVPRSRIVTESRGAVPFEDMPRESRRVEIAILP